MTATKRVAPETLTLFRVAKEQVMANDFPMRDFILEMLDVGERCFVELERKRQYNNVKVREGRTRVKEVTK